MLDDVTSAALRTAASGLARRQRVIADNIANVQTPGYLAGRVSFEGALRSALDNGADPAAVPVALTRSTGPTNLNGNNVSLDEEVLSNVETGLSYELTLRALDDKYGLLHTVIRAGG